jgi:hypothetical protein
MRLTSSVTLGHCRRSFSICFARTAGWSRPRPADQRVEVWSRLRQRKRHVVACFTSLRRDHTESHQTGEDPAADTKREDRLQTAATIMSPSKACVAIGNPRAKTPRRQSSPRPTQSPAQNASADQAPAWACRGAARVSLVASWPSGLSRGPVSTRATNPNAIGTVSQAIGRRQ